MKILILTRYEDLGASSRLRTFQYIPWLEKSGISCVINSLIDNSMLRKKYVFGTYKFTDFFKSYLLRVIKLIHIKEYDLIFIEKEAFPYLPAWFEVFLLKNKPYILDYDDAIFHNYDQHKSFLIRFFLGKRIDRLMIKSSLVMSGNEYLAKRAYQSGAKYVKIFPTVIDLERYKINLVKSSSKLRVVWIGSPSTVKYLISLHDALVELNTITPFTLRVIGGGNVKLEGIDVELVDWSELTEVASIQACDIGIMPLFDSPWEYGKCGYKLIQYMGCGLPVVASPIGVNNKIVDHGENGFLASSKNDWVKELKKLLNDPALRKKQGSNGRKLVEHNYCIQKNSKIFVDLLNSVMNS